MDKREINYDTPIVTLSVGELINIVRGAKPVEPKKRFVYGYKGVQELFHCGQTKAWQLVNGKIKPACKKEGKTIIVDVEKALELIG